LQNKFNAFKLKALNLFWSVSCFKRYLLNYANNVANDFLLLITISIVWYVFFAFNILFFYGGGHQLVKIWIFLGALSCILLTVSLLCESDYLTNKLTEKID